MVNLDILGSIPNKNLSTSKKRICCIRNKNKRLRNSKKIRDYVETIGEKIASDEKKESDRKIGKNGHIIEWEGAQPQKQGAAYMQLDGSMVQTRELGWKEVRNGILFRDKDNSDIAIEIENMRGFAIVPALSEDESLRRLKGLIPLIELEDKIIRI